MPVDVTDPDDPATRRDAGSASKNSPDASSQLVGVERLGDVIVGTEIEPLGLVGRRALRGEQDHGDRSPLAELAHHLDPVQVGHDDVEEHDVGPDFLGLPEGLLAAGRGDHPKPLVGQRDRNELGDPGLVIRDEHERLVLHRLRRASVTQSVPGTGCALPAHRRRNTRCNGRCSP